MAIEPQTGPCYPWARLTDVENCNCSDVDAYLGSQFIEIASETLFNLSGRQFTGGYVEDDGEYELAACSETIRPCASRITARTVPAWNYETVLDGGLGYGSSGSFFPWGWWPTGGSCGCGGGAIERCGCGGLSQIPLPNFPAVSITSVVVDGVTLANDGSAYRIDDFYWLVRVGEDADGNPARWPCCQDLRLPATENHTWAVTYEWGAAPPLAGVRAAADLACNLYRACIGQDCQLPSRVSQVVREGITYLVANDIESMLAAGHTGLTSVDTFLSTYNPRSIRQAPSVWSPDLGIGSVRSTWP